MSIRLPDSTALFGWLILTLILSGILSSVIASQLVVGPEGPQGEQGVPGLGSKPGYTVLPAYDSGWVEINSEETVFSHSLGDMNVLVQVMYRDTNNRIYPEMVSWNLLSPQTITVKTNFTPAEGQVRVMLWRVPYN